MGMDVYGRKPKNETGEYFRRNVWGWHPLWEYCCEANPEITQLGEGEQGTRQKIDQKKTSYITKVENKQIRLKTQD